MYKKFLVPQFEIIEKFHLYMKVNLIKLQRENLKVEKENVIQSSREKKS
jgi:hypothetical protein